MINQNVILLAEDDGVDVLLTRRAFTKAGLRNPLHVVSDGVEALAYLSGEGQYADRSQHPLPVLLLLDLKMPHKNGLEVLEWIRDQPELSDLRVVVLTGSDQPQDIQDAYRLGATSYLTKPLVVEHLVQVCGTLADGCLCIDKPSEAVSSILKSA